MKSSLGIKARFLCVFYIAAIYSPTMSIILIPYEIIRETCTLIM
jgi:hypothetical protein